MGFSKYAFYLILFRVSQSALEFLGKRHSEPREDTQEALTLGGGVQRLLQRRRKGNPGSKLATGSKRRLSQLLTPPLGHVFQLLFSLPSM